MVPENISFPKKKSEKFQYVDGEEVRQACSSLLSKQLRLS